MEIYKDFDTLIGEFHLLISVYHRMQGVDPDSDINKSSREKYLNQELKFLIAMKDFMDKYKKETLSKLLLLIEEYHEEEISVEDKKLFKYYFDIALSFNYTEGKYSSIQFLPVSLFIKKHTLPNIKNYETKKEVEEFNSNLLENIKSTLSKIEGFSDVCLLKYPKTINILANIENSTIEEIDNYIWNDHEEFLEVGDDSILNEFICLKITSDSYKKIIDLETEVMLKMFCSNNEYCKVGFFEYLLESKDFFKEYSEWWLEAIMSMPIGDTFESRSVSSRDTFFHCFYNEKGVIQSLEISVDFILNDKSTYSVNKIVYEPSDEKIRHLSDIFWKMGTVYDSLTFTKEIN